MSNQFNFSSIVYKIVRSREIGSANSPQRVGVTSALVDCACGFSWTARAGAGIDGVLGGSLVTCPSCGACESVSGRELGI